MHNRKRGEISTILAIGTLLVIGVATIVSSLIIKERQTTKTKAAENYKCKVYSSEISGCKGFLTKISEYDSTAAVDGCDFDENTSLWIQTECAISRKNAEPCSKDSECESGFCDPRSSLIAPLGDSVCGTRPVSTVDTQPKPQAQVQPQSAGSTNWWYIANPAASDINQKCIKVTDAFVDKNDCQTRLNNLGYNTWTNTTCYPSSNECTNAAKILYPVQPPQPPQTAPPPIVQQPSLTCPNGQPPDAATGNCDAWVYVSDIGTQCMKITYNPSSKTCEQVRQGLQAAPGCYKNQAECLVANSSRFLLQTGQTQPQPQAQQLAQVSQPQQPTQPQQPAPQQPQPQQQQPPPLASRGDANGDGKIDLVDFEILRRETNNEITYTVKKAIFNFATWLANNIFK